MTDSFLTLLLLFGMGYGLLIGIFTFGFFRIREYHPAAPEQDLSVSVIIAVRNESSGIRELLESLYKQETDNIRLEAIIVDDHSSDDTPAIVREFIASHPEMNLKVLESKKGLEGKKATLALGIRLAGGDIILTTDGDCRMGPSWITGFASYYLRFRPKLISGPVVYEASGGFFSAFRSLEFLSLIGSGAGAIGAGTPIMCNGANMAFEKAVWEELMQNPSSGKYVSGDDVFLLHEIKNKYGGTSIHFLKDKGAIVTTTPPPGLGGLLNQRFRWVSKSRGYQDVMTVVTAFGVFFYSFFTMLLFIISLFLDEFLLPFLILFFIKLIIDLPVLAGICRFTSRQRLLWYYLPVQALHIPFIVFTGIAGNLAGFSWKGRKSRI